MSENADTIKTALDFIMNDPKDAVDSVSVKIGDDSEMILRKAPHKISEPCTEWCVYVKGSDYWTNTYFTRFRICDDSAGVMLLLYEGDIFVGGLSLISTCKLGKVNE